MNKKTLINIGVLVIGILILISLILFFSLYLPIDYEKSEKIFLIEKGEEIKEIADKLKREGLIRNKFAFLFYLILTDKYKKFQAGYYSFLGSMNAFEIVEKISRGEVIKKRITIIEGWNLRDIGSYFKNLGIVMTEKEFWEKITGYPPYMEYLSTPSKDFSQEFGFLKEKPKNLTLEGFLFPDTYEIYKFGEDLETIIKKMLKNFNQKLTLDLQIEIKRQDKTIFEIITMASLLEKEVVIFEDKKIVAGILWKRLKNNMPLQVDATITYLTGKKTTKISIKETQIDSPYNTYRYKGLPLGPICNPGLESILAAIYPQESFYWYYLSTPERKTIFSQTFKEHLLAKKRYLK